jgi:hypothetical protein
MKRLLAAVLVLVAMTACEKTGPGSASVHVGAPTHYLTVVENENHGNLMVFRAAYQDGYVHGTILPSGAGAVTHLEHFTCINPENHGPSCAASSAGNDALLPDDPEDWGTLGQTPTGVNHNVHLDFLAAGDGSTLQWRTFEHRGHTYLEFDFADGFELYVYLDQPYHLYDVKLATQPNTSTNVSYAYFTATDS